MWDDDDVGFLTAIKTFMTTTKRPVILTTSDPSFKAKFDGDFEAILFKNPFSSECLQLSAAAVPG